MRRYAVSLTETDAGKLAKKITKKQKVLSKKQKDRTLKVYKKLEKAREKKRIQKIQEQEKLNKEAERLFNDYKERLNIIKSPNLDLYKRRKLAEELMEFVNKYINAQFREMFFNDIENIMNQFRQEEIKSSGVNEDHQGQGVMVMDSQNNLNILHVKVAYQIWSKMKTQFNNPVDVGLRLKNHYYEQTLNRNEDEANQGDFVEEQVDTEQGDQQNQHINEENIPEDQLNNAPNGQVLRLEDQLGETPESQSMPLVQERTPEDLVVNKVLPDN